MRGDTIGGGVQNAQVTTIHMYAAMFVYPYLKPPKVGEIMAHKP